MFTPQMIKELVLGFIFTEGLIRELSEVKDCTISHIKEGPGEESIEAKVTLASDRIFPVTPEETRVSYSSCGICGKEDFQELKRGVNRVKSRQRFSMSVFHTLSQKIMQVQPLYKRTGGAHAAVLFDSKGQVISHSEDMGRHNALDKVIGSLLMKGLSSEDKILVSSGRASLEMILKTARVGFPVFVAMSRPTSRAVEAAKFYNITLIDFAKRSNRIYTHARRIEGF